MNTRYCVIIIIIIIIIVDSALIWHIFKLIYLCLPTL
jgi:hypothetical protein